MCAVVNSAGVRTSSRRGPSVVAVHSRSDAASRRAGMVRVVLVVMAVLRGGVMVRGRVRGAGSEELGDAAGGGVEGDHDQEHGERPGQQLGPGPGGDPAAEQAADDRGGGEQADDGPVRC